MCFFQTQIIKRRKIVSIPKKDSTPLKKEPQQITLIRDKVKGYGFSLGHQLFIKEIDEKGVAANDGGIRSGDVLMKVKVFCRVYLSRSSFYHLMVFNNCLEESFATIQRVLLPLFLFGV